MRIALFTETFVPKMTLVTTLCESVRSWDLGHHVLVVRLTAA